MEKIDKAPERSKLDFMRDMEELIAYFGTSETIPDYLEDGRATIDVDELKEHLSRAKALLHSIDTYEPPFVSHPSMFTSANSVDGGLEYESSPVRRMAIFEMSSEWLD